MFKRHKSEFPPLTRETRRHNTLAVPSRWSAAQFEQPATRRLITRLRKERGSLMQLDQCLSISTFD